MKQMTVKVTSHLFEQTDLSGEYELPSPLGIDEFIDRMGLRWDVDVLVVVNDSIVKKTYVLQPGDHVYLLTPLTGG